MKLYIFQCVRVVLLGVFASLVPASQAFAADLLQINMVFVAGNDNDYAQHRAGAELGVSEGNIQGQFLGINYALEAQTTAQVLAVDVTALPAAVIVAGEASLLREVQSVYAPHGVSVFNIALQDDALRQACLENVFHTPPSERMLADAVSQWQQANPGAQVTAQAWHPEFVKFAGRDLNRRFTEQHGAAMDDAAWSGWAATRGLAEAVVRTMSNDPEVITAFIKDTLSFDGQKGVAQTYRETGQLRQPLLMTENGRLLGEAPVRGVAADTDLDSLGFTVCQ